MDPATLGSSTDALGRPPAGTTKGRVGVLHHRRAVRGSGDHAAPRPPPAEDSSRVPVAGRTGAAPHRTCAQAPERIRRIKHIRGPADEHPPAGREPCNASARSPAPGHAAPAAAQLPTAVPAGRSSRTRFPAAPTTHSATAGRAPGPAPARMVPAGARTTGPGHSAAGAASAPAGTSPARAGTTSACPGPGGAAAGGDGPGDRAGNGVATRQGGEASQSPQGVPPGQSCTAAPQEPPRAGARADHPGGVPAAARRACRRPPPVRPQRRRAVGVAVTLAG